MKSVRGDTLNFLKEYDRDIQRHVLDSQSKESLFQQLVEYCVEHINLIQKTPLAAFVKQEKVRNIK